MPIDLFKLQVDESKLNPNFQQLLLPKFESARELLNAWASNFQDRDNKLVKEFQTTFNSVFWELYLFNLFRHWNLSIDFTRISPDFNIKEFGGISVEATIANNARDTMPEWSFSGKEIEFGDFASPKQFDIFINESIIRLSNAFTGKLRKYKNTYTELPHVKRKPFIIAIAPFDRPFFFWQLEQAIEQLLYAQRIRFDERTSKHYWKEVNFVEKENGAQIDLGLFTDSRCSEISAVIFSSVATFGKIEALANTIKPFPINFHWIRYDKNSYDTPHMGFSPGSIYRETIDDGINIFLNPFAKHPVPEEFIKLFQTVHWHPSKTESKDNSLLSRQSITITVGSDEDFKQQ
jgi:hypothetical protein